MWRLQRRAAAALASCVAGCSAAASSFASKAAPRWSQGPSHELAPGAAVPSAGLLALNTLRDNPGARKQKKRVGRGIGSGMGKTSTRGHKGQKARSGNKPHLAFEGGQTPLRRRLPKRGFVNTESLRMEPLNLDTLTEALASGRLELSGERPLNMKDLSDSGTVSKIRHGVKLLGRGAAGFAASGLEGVSLEVSRASASARAAIEAAGGTLTTVHYNRLSLRALLKPHKFMAVPGVPPLLPRPARPPPRLRDKVQAIGGLPAGAPPTPLPPLIASRRADARAVEMPTKQ